MLDHFRSGTFICILVWFVIAGCSGILSGEGEDIYHYRAYDPEGKLVVHGQMTLEIMQDGDIEGTWRLHKLDEELATGPQSGYGHLVGGNVGDSAWIELQPQYRDNNVQLTGKLIDGQFTGRWMWISFSGITGQGTFEAVK